MRYSFTREEADISVMAVSCAFGCYMIRQFGMLGGPKGSDTVPATIFYSYSHKDEKAREKLASHLALLKRSGLITDWSDRQIDAGQQFVAA